jgi:Helix-turn-helix domain
MASTRQRARAQDKPTDSLAKLAASPRTFLDRDNWMRAVLASDLPDAAVRVAMSIALHLHVNTGRCNPSYATLAADSHVSERSTYRLVDLLEHRGWIAITRSTGRLNNYTLLTPDRALAGVGAHPTPDRATAGDHCQNEHPTPDRATAGDHCQYAGSLKAQRAKKRTAERESDSATPDFFAPREGKKSGGAKQAHRKKSTGQTAASFDQFWAAYPRRVAKDAARRAFDAAITRGAHADALIGGAKRYAVERKGEPPKWTKHPATWLNGGCWEDEAPGAPVIDQSGEVVAYEQPPPQSDRPLGYVAIGEMLARRAEIEGGW